MNSYLVTFVYKGEKHFALIDSFNQAGQFNLDIANSAISCYLQAHPDVKKEGAFPTNIKLFGPITHSDEKGVEAPLIEGWERF